MDPDESGRMSNINVERLRVIDLRTVRYHIDDEEHAIHSCDELSP